MLVPTPQLHLALALALALVACQRHGYVIPGEDSLTAQAPLVSADADPAVLRDARARPRPHLEVEPASAIDSRGRLGEVVAHGHADRAGMRRLEVALEPEGRVVVTYEPPGGDRIPASPGDAVALRLVPPEAEADFRGPALAVWTREGRLLAAIAAGGGLPKGILGSDVAVGPSRRLAYSEIRRLPGLCVVITRHFEARVQEDGSFRYVPPGSYDRLTIDGRPYRLVVLDVARPGDTRCPAEPEGTLAFAVLALPEEGASAPADGQDEPPSGGASGGQVP
ncbi:MAG: hypothetical protein ACQEXJ_11590 [Myxococcota bacterium]